MTYNEIRPGHVLANSDGLWIVCSSRWDFRAFYSSWEGEIREFEGYGGDEPVSQKVAFIPEELL